MKHEIDLENYQVRTDLITEIIKDNKDLEKNEKLGIKIESINLDEDKALELKKKKGFYETIFFDDVTDEVNYKNLLTVLEEELKKLFSKNEITKKGSVLVIGLGNRNSTPDALGVLTADNITVTRHLFLLNLDVLEKYRSIASIIPGVMGTTGIETSDMIKAVAKKVKPDFIIAIDSLCASSIERLNKTIQITNTGINPGSGIGNNRKEISNESLNIPVIAIGVPTVLDSSVLVSNTLTYLLNHLSYEKDNQNKKSLKFISTINRDYKNHQEHLSEEEKENILGLVGLLDEDNKRALLREVLMPLGYNYIVTPKEIDFVIMKLSKLIAEALNNSLLLA